MHVHELIEYPKKTRDWRTRLQRSSTRSSERSGHTFHWEKQNAYVPISGYTLGAHRLQLAHALRIHLVSFRVALAISWHFVPCVSDIFDCASPHFFS
jgi:hypothetical protein